MDETRWLAAASPLQMLAALRRTRRAARTKAGRRKLRLFACACCRRLWPALLPDRRVIVETAERAADGLVPLAEIQMAWAAAYHVDFAAQGLSVLSFFWGLLGGRRAAVPAPAPSEPLPLRSLFWRLSRTESWTAAYLWREASGPLLTKVRGTRPEQERRAQADLVRCIFGNPFRPVTFDPAWRTATTVGLARSAYEEPAFDRLPILADALEDAGCDDPAILNHCRNDPHHARGCWVVDALLGR